MPLSQLSDGRYYLNLGFAEVGNRKQPKFMLDRDSQQAEMRATYVRECWRINTQRMGEEVWAEPFLSIAKLLAKGQREIQVDLSFCNKDEDRARWIHALSHDLPFARISCLQSIEAGQRSYEQDAEQQLKQAEKALDEASEYGAVAGMKIVRGREGLALLRQNKRKLFDAFDAYVERDVKERNIHSDSKQLKQYGKLRIKRINRFKRDFTEMGLADMTLSQLNGAMCEKLCNFYRNRPIGKRTKKIVSVKDAEHCIKELRRFINWLNRTEEFNWDRPKGFDDLSFPVEKTLKEKKIVTVIQPVYSIEELTVIARHATPSDRLILFTCINCGMGAAEIGRVITSDILFNHHHEHTRQLVFESSKEDNFLRYLRPKTGVFGEWWLWPETVTVLKAGVERAKKIGSDILICSKHGKPIYNDLASDNPQSRFTNKWNNLIKRVRKSHPTFRRLPFGSLRDTLADYIRHRYDGELASMGLCHGSPYKGDNLLECYAGKPFGRFHKALRELHSLFLPMLQAPSAYEKQSKRYRAIERVAEEVGA